jgi:hypothetical protein
MWTRPLEKGFVPTFLVLSCRIRRLGKKERGQLDFPWTGRSLAGLSAAQTLSNGASRVGTDGARMLDNHIHEFEYSEQAKTNEWGDL